MRTAYITHADCHDHDTGPGHPESAQRLSAIEDRFIENRVWDFLRPVDAPEVTREQLLRVHTPGHIEKIEASIPRTGHARLDQDTVVSPGSLAAAKRAAGAAVAAVNLIMNGT
ncbi:MAG: histone deacetylase family protein, partial [Lysobacterales bacterium]